jgi:hypothetical protein
MTISLRSAIPALLCAASVAGAQGTPAPAGVTAPACDPGVSQAVAKATLFLQQAAASIKAQQDASKPLKQAIGALTEPSKDSKEVADSVGRAYYLGQAYILLLEQPGVAASGPRSNYGIATEPAANINVLAAADSAFTMVEAAQPGCKTEISEWRQQKPWLDAVKAAIAAVNDSKFDSAEVYARRALTIDRRAPYAYTVLASVASSKNDFPTATAMLHKAIAAASADTIYNDAKMSAMYDLANTLFSQYDAATGAAKDSLGRASIAAWEAYIPISNDDARTARGELVASQIALALKDTAEYTKIYAPVLANPARYGDHAVLNAGVLATQADRPDDAVKLFSTVANRNPYQRDALKNLAASYVGAKQPDKVAAVVDKLVKLDPNNASNWLLYAYGYSGLLKQTKDKALTKAYTDSLVKYNTKSEKLTPNLEVTEFTVDSAAGTATLAGKIENRGAKPGTYTLQVEFLGKDGSAVGTQSVTIGPVAPKASMPFTAKATAHGVVGYRYAPID